MSIKVNKIEQTAADTALTTQLAGALSIPVEELMKVSSPDSRLPVIKLINSIEVSPAKGITKDLAGMLVLVDGDMYRVIPKGAILTVIAGRDSTRRLEVEVGGVKVVYDKANPSHEKMDKTYSRFYKKLGQYEKSHAKYLETLNDSSYQKGSVYICALITDEGCAIVSLPAYKTQCSYWYRPLASAALLPTKRGIKVLNNDHSANLIAAKNNPAHQYYSPKKAESMFEGVDITKEQMVQIMQALEVKSQDVSAWFAQ